MDPAKLNKLVVLLIEDPPLDGNLLDYHPALHATLTDDREWFAATPVEIGVSDGVVTYASTELPILSLLD